MLSNAQHACLDRPPPSMRTPGPLRLKARASHLWVAREDGDQRLALKAYITLQELNDLRHALLCQVEGMWVLDEDLVAAG